MIGPASNDDWWPRIVMLKALTQYHEVTGDARVIPVMDKYFRYQLGELPTRPLRDWGKFRWQDELLSVHLALQPDGLRLSARPGATAARSRATTGRRNTPISSTRSASRPNTSSSKRAKGSRIWRWPRME